MADIGRQHVAAPAVVVAGHPEHWNAAVHEAREFAQHTHAGTRHHVAPLEPEVEQVAVDDHRPRIVGKAAQEREQVAFRLLGRDAEMSVGEHVAGRGKHRGMVSRARALYKPLPEPIDSPR